MAKPDYCGVSPGFMATDSKYQPWAHAVADALYAVLDNKQFCGKVLEQMATGSGVPKADGSGFDGRMASTFDAALKGLRKCPDAQLTAAASLARLCHVELQPRVKLTSSPSPYLTLKPTCGLPPFCLAVETAATFRGVVCCMQRALEVTPNLPLPNVLSQVRPSEELMCLLQLTALTEFAA